MIGLSRPRLNRVLKCGAEFFLLDSLTATVALAGLTVRGSVKAIDIIALVCDGALEVIDLEDGRDLKRAQGAAYSPVRPSLLMGAGSAPHPSAKPLKRFRKRQSVRGQRSGLLRGIRMLFTINNNFIYNSIWLKMKRT